MKNLIIILIIFLTSCNHDNSIQPTIVTNNNQLVKSYTFIGQLNIPYDNNLHKVLSVSYSYPSDYSWGSDTLKFYNNNTFTGFGSGTYINRIDSTILITNNWVGTNNIANFKIEKAKMYLSNSVPMCYFNDTLFNLNSFDNDSIYVVYLIGKDPTQNINYVRMSLFH